MGVGKSSVGRALSRRTGWPYRDNDQLVARATGSDTRSLAEQQGERALRAAESAALQEALRVPVPVIAGIAAGVVEDEGDRSRLDRARRDGGLVVWLQAPAEVLAARVRSHDQARPWLRGDAETTLRQLAERRERWYAEVADVAVDTSRRAAEEAADAILQVLSPAP